MVKIAIIYGSVRKERQGLRVAKHITNVLKEKGFEAMLIDPKEYDLPLLEEKINESTTNKKQKELQNIIKNADGYVFVSAEYNHLPAPALINLLDHFHQEYSKKAVGIAGYSTGSFGGMRAAISLRTLAGGLGLISIPTILSFPNMIDLIDENANPLENSTNERTSKFIDELIWYTKALKNQK